MSNNNSLVSLEKVVKRFQTGDSAIYALKEINVQIKDGDFVMVMGPSGSGKTTLLNVMAGLANPTEGYITIDNEILNKLSDNQKAELRRKKIGFIFQFYNLHEGLTAQENIELPMIIARSKSRKERDDSSKELLELVNLSHRINNKPFELSGGERQRVGIARALANDPPLILADEPTGDLDSKLAGEIIDLLISLNQKFKKTLVVVTHDLNLLRPGMRLLKMEDGLIIDDLIVNQDVLTNLSSQNEEKMAEIA